MMAVVEISLDSVASAIAAEQGGAHRIELCSALSEGGVTPSLGLLRAVRAATRLSLQVLIRPRGGDFLYSDDEVAVMRTDIQLAADAGADGVVFGLLTPEGHVDERATEALARVAGDMEVTFHRAIDLARDPVQAVQAAMRCGARRILSSGAAASAPAGCMMLKEMVDTAGSRATILAGGGVRPANVDELARCAGLCEFHASLRRVVPSEMRFVRTELSLGHAESNEYQRTVVLAEDVRALVEAAQQAVSSLPHHPAPDAFAARTTP